jgi:hypothetical protein
MTRLLDKLNLRPQERRLVIFVAVVVFAALNWFFVRPYFGELGRYQQRMKDADKDIKKFNDEIQRKPVYIKQISELSKQGGQVSTEERATSLTREVDNQANAAGMGVQNLSPATRSRDGRTNSFFEEQAINLTFNNTGESELVNFMYNLASQQSLIRVKSMMLRPDQGRMKLAGTLTLVESYQKKPQGKTVAAATAAPAPAPKTTTPAAPPKTAPTPAKLSNPATTRVTNAVSKPTVPTKTPTPIPGTSGAPMRTNTPPKRLGAPPAPLK